jgi:hypothetical protein
LAYAAKAKCANVQVGSNSNFKLKHLGVVKKPSDSVFARLGPNIMTLHTFNSRYKRISLLSYNLYWREEQHSSKILVLMHFNVLVALLVGKIINGNILLFSSFQVQQTFPTNRISDQNYFLTNNFFPPTNKIFEPKKIQAKIVF